MWGPKRFDQFQETGLAANNDNFQFDWNPDVHVFLHASRNAAQVDAAYPKEVMHYRAAGRLSHHDDIIGLKYRHHTTRGINVSKPKRMRAYQGSRYMLQVKDLEDNDGAKGDASTDTDPTDLWYWQCRFRKGDMWHPEHHLEAALPADDRKLRTHLQNIPVAYFVVVTYYVKWFEKKRD
jgi:hypothetical protein